jgi:hypothetical protein
LPHGAQAAQLIHAAGESSPGNLDAHTFAIALVARDELHLREIGQMLEDAGIEHKRVVECDFPYGGQLMAIGIKPIERGRLKKYLSKLPLLK